ncbi:MAG: DNA polymerase IV [Planctomycetota bacterium]
MTPATPTPSSSSPPPPGADMPRVILHADMDCFFAAVEVLDNPDLRGKPVAVGGSPTGRGVVASCNYEARRFGVRSAMPMARAIRQCPQLVICRGQYGRYRELSDKVFDIFERYTPVVQAVSIDEAFLDVTGSQRLHGDGPTIAAAIRRDVLADLGLVVSVGVAPNRFVAKIASDLRKPDALCVAPFDGDELAAWLAPLPVRRMWGVGPATEARLKRHGFNTFGDLQRASDALLLDRLGEHGLHWRDLALGRDARPVRTDREREKSIGKETTFAEDIADRVELRSIISRLSDQVASRARRRRMAGKRIVVKIRHPDFHTITRNRTLKVATDEAELIFRNAWEVFEANVEEDQALRLVGVTLQGLESTAAADRPRTLFDALDRPAVEAADESDDEADDGRVSVDEEMPIEVDDEQEYAPPGSADDDDDDDDDAPPLHSEVDSVMDRIRDRLGHDAIRRGRDLRTTGFRDRASEEDGYRRDRNED